MLQVICSCNRIAEVRHRSNGNKLAYTHCVACGGGPVSAVLAAEIEKIAKNDIGVKGEFFDKSPVTVQSKQDETLKDFEPEPENLGGDTEIKTEQPPVKSSGVLKIAFGLLFAAVLGGGAYQIGKVKG
jgi:hypothetical protein